MFQFIITNILMLSLGTILYLLVRSLPRIDESEANSANESLIERWVASEIPERVDDLIKTFTGKLLRKFKVFLLKIDNLLTERLKKIKNENGNGRSKISFGDIRGEKTVAEEEKLNNN